MATLTNQTRKRTVGSTTAFATGGTALGGAVATIIHELLLPDLTANGALALGVVCSALLALAGGWLAPSSKAETEAYLGSVLAMARQGDHGRLGTAQPGQAVEVEQVEPATATEQEQPVKEPELAEIPDGYELVDTAGTEYSNPAYALGK